MVQPTGALTHMSDTVQWESFRSRRHYDPAKEKSLLYRLERWWVIDPRTSRWFTYWDILCMVALVFVALVTPFEVAFLESLSSAGEIVAKFRTAGWLFLINRVVDVVFTVDLVLQFRLMYTETTAIVGVRWIDDARTIIRHYFFGWFPLDFLSIVVSALDVVPLLGGSDDVRDLRVLRVMRVLRLIKLVRLLRASRVFRRWETRMAINYSRLSLAKSLLYVTLLSHWFACIWGLQVALLDSRRGTWMQEFEYCVEPGVVVVVPTAPPSGTTLAPAASTVANNGSSRAAADDLDLVCPGGPWALYSASVYWAVMTITSIGYGDIHASDRNVSEQVVNTFLMLIGGMLWGHVIGTFCGVVATMSPQTTEFNRRMDDLNRFVHMHNMPSDVCRRLREYLHQTKHLQVAAASKELIELLSPSLQGEVTWIVHRPWLQRVAFFHGSEPEFLVQIALSLTPMVFTPGELAVNGFLYIVHRGIALYGGRVLTMGKVWGEDCIIESVHLQRRWCARAMNYLEVYMLSRNTLLAVASAFPNTYNRIRKTAIRMAVRRQFVLAAKLMSGGKGFFASKTGVFDRILEQATMVPLTEMRLQGTLTAHRLEVNSMALVNRDSNMMDLLPPADCTANERSSQSASKTGEDSGVGSPPAGESVEAAAHAKGAVALTPAPASAAEDGSGPGVSSDLQAVTSALKINAKTPAPSAMAVSTDVLAALESTKRELHGRLDALGEGLAAVQKSVAELASRLPAPQPAS